MVHITEFWFNGNIRDDLLPPENFRQDRTQCKKKIDCGVAVHVSTQSSILSSTVSNYSSDVVDFVVGKCYPKCSLSLAKQLEMILVRSMIISYLFHAYLSSDCLCFDHGDFNHASIYLLLAFGLPEPGLIPHPTRNDAVLDRVITNHPNLCYL